LTTTITKTRLRIVQSRLAPAEEADAEEGRTLWRCILRCGIERDEFLFRSGDKFEDAANQALHLVTLSPSCQMVKAVIVAVERVAKLWN
jgi:hypothetical protein